MQKIKLIIENIEFEVIKDSDGYYLKFPNDENSLLYGVTFSECLAKLPKYIVNLTSNTIDKSSLDNLIGFITKLK